MGASSQIWWVIDYIWFLQQETSTFHKWTALSAGAVEYTNCISAEG